MKLKNVLTLACAMLSVNSVLCQSGEETRNERKNSISLGAFLVFGNIQLNYERLILPNHGLVVEGFWDSDAPGLNTYTLGFTYRYHFRDALDGFFLAAFYRTGIVQQQIKAKENILETNYTMETKLNLLGVGTGYRWILKNGLSFLVRAGYGYQMNANYDWTPSVPTDKRAVRNTKFLQGMDLELGVGYSF